MGVQLERGQCTEPSFQLLEKNSVSLMIQQEKLDTKILKYHGTMHV